MDHLAIPVRDQAASRRFYETYFGFGAHPAREYDGGEHATFAKRTRKAAPARPAQPGSRSNFPA